MSKYVRDFFAKGGQNFDIGEEFKTAREAGARIVPLRTRKKTMDPTNCYRCRRNHRDTSQRRLASQFAGQSDPIEILAEEEYQSREAGYSLFRYFGPGSGSGSKTCVG